MYDIVYVLKDGVPADELRYSLRSVCANFPYRKIWFFGGKPESIDPDEWVYVRQRGVEVWEKSTSSIVEACRTKGVTDNFWLFNDDFFVLQPIEDMPAAYFDKTIAKRIEQIRGNIDGQHSLYTRKLERTQAILELEGKKTFNYAVHIPMLINKRKALEVIKRYREPMFRCLYGNYWNVGGRQMADVKIVKLDEVPKKGAKFASTSEKSFNKGKVGEYIRAKFPEPCKYEN